MIDIDDDLHTAASRLRARADHQPPDVDRVRAAHRRQQRRRRTVATSGVVIVLAGFAAMVIAVDRNSETTTTPMPAAVAPAEPAAPNGPAPEESAPIGNESGASPAEVDPAVYRALLDSPIGVDQPRFVRLWVQQESGTGIRDLISEQWYAPDGTAVAAVGPIGVGEGPEWTDARRRLASPQVIIDVVPDSSFGYPEASLESASMSVALAAPDGPESTPAVFTTVSSMGGVDGSYLPVAGTTVREAVRLYPTVMQQAHLEAMSAALLALDGATSTPGVVDVLGRPATRIDVPLPLVDPPDGEAELRASFWVDADASILQIEWLLVAGTLPGSGATQFRDTTVVLAAGEVAAVPRDADAYARASAVPPSTIARDPGVFETALSGNGWRLEMGEAANPGTGTYKVCHVLFPADEQAEMANGLGVSGCGDWPAGEVVFDEVTIHELDSGLVIAVVSLGSRPVDALDVEGASSVARERLPGSGKQFAVVEFVSGVTSSRFEAVTADGTVLEVLPISWEP